MTQLADDPRLNDAFARVSASRGKVVTSPASDDPRLLRALDRVEGDRIASRNPFGTFKAPDFSDVSFAENFRRGFSGSAAPFIAPLGDVGARLAESARSEAPAGGAGGFLGSVSGSVLPSALMVLAPSTSPAIATAFAGVAASEDLRENQNVQSAIGAAIFEASAEFVGAGLVRRVGIKTSAKLGQAVLRGDSKAIVTIGLAGLQDAGIEGGEEGLTLLADTINKVRLGLLTPQEGVDKLKSEGLLTVAGGATGGLILGPVSAVSPASIREFKRSSKDVKALSSAINDMAPGQRAALLAGVEGMLNDNAASDGKLLTDEELFNAKAVQRKLLGAELVEGEVASNAVEQQAEKRDAKETIQSPVQETQQAEHAAAAREILQDPTTTARQKAESLIRTETDQLRQELLNQRKKARETVAQTARSQRAELRNKVSELRKRADDKDADIRQLSNDVRRFVRESKLSKAQKESLLASRSAQIRTKKQFVDFADRILKAELATEQSKSQGELKKALKDASKFEGLGPSDKAALQSITGEIDAKNITDKTLFKLGALAEHLNRNRAAQLPLGHVENLKRLGQKPVSEFTADEANDAADAINTILRQAELKKKLVNSLSERDSEKTKALIRAEIAQNTLFPDDEQRESGDPRKLLKPRKRLDTGALSPESKESVLDLIWGIEQVSSIDTIAEFISGSDSSVTHQVLVDDINIGKELSLDLFYDMSDAWESGLQDLGIVLAGKQLETMSDELNQKRGLVRQMFGQEQVETESREVQIGGKPVKMSPSRWMMLSALLKDNTTLDLVLFGKAPLVASNLPNSETFTMTSKDVQSMEDSLSFQEKGIVSLFVDMMNGPAKQAYIDYTMGQFGVDRTQDGVWVSRRRRVDGGVIDRKNLTQKAEDNVGLNKFRTKDKKLAINIPDIFVEFSNVVWTVSHLKHLSPALRSANEVIADPGVRDQLNEVRGKRAIKAFETTYDAVSAEVVGKTISPSITDSAFRNLVRNTTTALLGFNLPVMGYQPMSLFHAAQEVPFRFIAMATAEGSQFKSDIDERMHRVGWIRFRDEGSTLGKVNEGSREGQSLLGFRAKENVGMLGIRYMDRAAIRTIWRASELQAMEQIGRNDVNDDLVFVTAAEIATRVMRRTQPTSDAMSLSGVALARRNSDAAALLFLFRAQLAKTVDMTSRNVIRATRDPSYLPQAIANISMIWIVSSLGIEAIREFYRWVLRGFKADPDDERGVFRRLATNTFFRMLSIPLFIGAVANLLRGYFSPNFSAVGSVVGDMVKKTRQAAIAVKDGEGFEKILDPAIDAAALIIGVSTGAPVVSPVREIKRVVKSLEKDASPGRRRKKGEAPKFGN